jgi:hypothetical protein
MNEENRIKCGDGFVEIGPVCPPIPSVFFPLNEEEMKSLGAKVVDPPESKEGDVDDTPQST